MTARDIEHDVAHRVNARRRHAFSREVGGGGHRRREQPFADAVGDDAVDFFRHGHVEGPQARFDMGDGNGQLDGGEGASQGGIGVAVDQHRVRRFGLQNLLDLHQHAPCHGAMRAAVNAAAEGRCAHAKFVEKDRRHIAVEMLARVHHHFAQGCRLGQGGRDHAGLDELRPCAEHGKNFA